MSKPALIILISLSSFVVRAQTIVDADVKAGFGKAVSLNILNGNKMSTRPVFTFSGAGLVRSSSRLSLGLTMQYQTFDFTENRSYSGHMGVVSEEVIHTSKYLCLTPIIDLGVGTHGFLHIYGEVPIGWLLRGRQVENLYIGYPDYKIEQIGTSRDISRIYCGLSFGLREMIPLASDKWFLVLDESYTFLLSALTDARGSQGGFNPHIHPSYANVQTGLIRRFALGKPRVKKVRQAYEYQNIGVPATAPH